jgi:adenosylcobinamide kinase/adenosylcobinamide-phosphate guanylyltransferase
VPLTFITGPVRSGKSRFAERLAREAGPAVTYVATARIDPSDAEWTARIAHHAARRPPAWRVIETAGPGSPSLAALARGAVAGQTLLVDSIGTWLADRMTRALEVSASSCGADASFDAAELECDANDLASALLETQAVAIVVGEEVGWGLVPPYPSGRVFRDVLGRMQQRLASGAAHAYLVVAGFAIDLRTHGRSVDGT